MITPATVIYRGPEGFTVITNEDGVHLGREGRVVLESVDLTRLLQLIDAARAQFDASTIPAPTPPTREEMRESMSSNRDRYAAQRAKNAIDAAFKSDEGVPF